jgi:hypothetical protein
MPTSVSTTPRKEQSEEEAAYLKTSRPIRAKDMYDSLMEAFKDQNKNQEQEQQRQ